MWLTIGSGIELGTTVEVSGPRFVIGRDDECDLVLGDEKVSRRHAVLMVVDGRVTLEDLDSANGTFVNGRRIHEPHALEGDEHIRLGDTALICSPTKPVPSTGGDGAQTGGPSRSTIQRLVHEAVENETRSVRLLVAAAILALLVIAGASVGGLYAGGVIGGSDGSTSTEDLVDRARPSVVGVYQAGGSGTGWVLDAKKGLIVTNEHVVDGAASFKVAVGTAKRPAKLIGVAPCDDLAVLQVADTSGLKTLSLAPERSIRQGEPVVALGYPANFLDRAELTATTGVISVAKGKSPGGLGFPTYVDVVQTNTPINPGNSGGPLLDSRGRLVGVNTFGSATGELQNINYAIRVDHVQEVTDVLRQGRSLGWPGAWLSFQEASSYENAGVPLGALVIGTFPGTPAAAAFPNAASNHPELITAIDGRRLDNNFTTYCTAVGRLSRGGSATFHVYPGRSVRMRFR